MAFAAMAAPASIATSLSPYQACARARAGMDEEISAVNDSSSILVSTASYQILQPNPFASAPKRRRTISTPLRPLPTTWSQTPSASSSVSPGNTGCNGTAAKTPAGPPNVGTCGIETGARNKKRHIEPATPMEIRFPLVSFFLRHGYPKALIQEAAEESVQHGAGAYKQQMLLLILEDIEERFTGLRGLQQILIARKDTLQHNLSAEDAEFMSPNKLDSLAAVRNQFVATALSENNWPLNSTSAANALRSCLHSLCDGLKARMVSILERVGSELRNRNERVDQVSQRRLGSVSRALNNAPSLALTDGTGSDRASATLQTLRPCDSNHLWGPSATPRKPPTRPWPAGASAASDDTTSPIPDETPLVMLLKREVASRRARNHLARAEAVAAAQEAKTAFVGSKGCRKGKALRGSLSTPIRLQLQAKFAAMPGRLGTIGEDDGEDEEDENAQKINRSSSDAISSVSVEGAGNYDGGKTENKRAGSRNRHVPKSRVLKEPLRSVSTTQEGISTQDTDHETMARNSLANRSRHAPARLGSSGATLEGSEHAQGENPIAGRGSRKRRTPDVVSPAENEVEEVPPELKGVGGVALQNNADEPTTLQRDCKLPVQYEHGARLPRVSRDFLEELPPSRGADSDIDSCELHGVSTGSKQQVKNTQSQSSRDKEGKPPRRTRRASQPARLGGHDDDGDRPEEVPNKRRTSRRRATIAGAGALLGSKPMPQNKKGYSSRVAQTQKAKRTKETKWLRKQMEQQSFRLNEQMGAVARVDEAKLAELRNVVDRRSKTEGARVDAARAAAEGAGLDFATERRCGLETDGVSELSASQDYQQFANQSSIDPRQVSPATALDLPPITDDWLKEILRDIFGLDNFRIGQLETLKKLLIHMAPKQDAVGCTLPLDKGHEPPPLYQMLCMPTGAGKSLVYQICAYLLATYLHRLSVVIAPVVSLLDDQYAKFRLALEGKLNVTRVHSSVEAAEIKLTYTAMQKGLVDVLFVTPEQFVSQRLWGAMSSRQIGMLVIDEAHCLSEWGHSFRPAYQRILAVSRRVFHVPVTLLLTATATKGTIASMETTLKKISGADNPSIAIAGTDAGDPFRRLDGAVTLVPDDAGASGSLNVLKDVLKSHDKNGIVLVYVWMKHVATRTCQWLREWFPNFRIELFHSSLDSSAKQKTVQALMNNKCDILVATQALGIGIDSPWVRRVIHLNQPASLEQYVQEAGRCNRGGKFNTSPADLILCPTDFRARHQQIRSSLVDRLAISIGLQQILFTEPEPQVVTEKLRRRSGGKAAGSEARKIVSVDVAQIHRGKGALRIAAAVASDQDNSQAMAKPVIFASTTDDLRLVTVETTPIRKRFPKYEIRLLQITHKFLAKLFNVRSDDDLAVILSLMETAAAELTSFDKPGTEQTSSSATLHLTNDPATLDSHVSAWNSVLQWWQTERRGTGSQAECFPTMESGHISSKGRSLATLKLWKTSVAGVELRAYERPIQELEASHPLLQYLATIWTAGAGQVYKVYWADAVARSGSLSGALVVDVDLLEAMIYDAADELQLSVRPISGFAKCAWFQVLVAANSDKWLTKAWKRVTDAVVNVLETNNRAQINRLCAAYVAFHLGKSSKKDMATFIQEYFSWDPEMEALPTSELWLRPELSWVTPLIASSGFSSKPGLGPDAASPLLTSPGDPASSCPPSNSTTTSSMAGGGSSSRRRSRPSVGIGDSSIGSTGPSKNNPVLHLLSQPFRTSDSLDVAQLRADVRRLLGWFAKSDKLITSSDSVRPPLDREVITPVTVARILCGISAAVYNTENAGTLPGWRSYVHTPFSRVVNMTTKLIRTDG